jgi:hypothetical protein
MVTSCFSVVLGDEYRSNAISVARFAGSGFLGELIPGLSRHVGTRSPGLSVVPMNRGSLTQTSTLTLG